MNRHASLNRVYRLIWSTVRHVWIPVAENTRGRGRRASRKLLAATLSLAAAHAHASGPSGGQVTAGTGSIAQSGAITTITQGSPTLSLTWTSFNIAPQETVDFVQPSASAIAVNRIFDANGTQILGHLNANGQVFLINPNGILFGPGAQVNVGGLVAATLDLNAPGSDANAKVFSGNSTASVVNEGTINADPGGYVVLLGSHVSNQGAITAQLGSVALAAGSAATLTFSDNSLVHLQVDRSLWQGLAENGGLIRADGGQVIMTAGAKDALLASVVNNTGVIEARTVENHDGTITLLGGMLAGTVNVGGTLDASAPNGGNGGVIETSAAHVEVAADAKVTTAAVMGRYGSWLIDPQDFTIAASGGDITGAALSSELGTTPVVVESSAGHTAGSGNVNVNDAVAWSANTALTLTASNNVNINANITATGNTAGLVIDPNTTNGTATASGTGIYNLHSGVSITLPGTTPSLSIAGTDYTVINTLGVSGSMTGTDLQGINVLLSGDYALGSNINAAATAGWNAGAGFTPIGTLGTPFTGTFDGLGNTISNLTISLTTPNVGLFGATGTGATVRNVGLVGGSVTGGAGTGGLVGNNGPGVPISGSYTTGPVNGAAGAGGLVGSNTTGAISDSYSTGSVSGAAGTGGLIGSSTSGAISDSYATGSANGAAGTGGLIGSSTSGAITGSYATGSVNGAAGTGGLIGSNTSGPISNSYATGNVNGNNGAGVGGLIGSNTSGTVTNSYAAGGVSGTGASVGALLGSSGAGVVTDSYWDKTTSLVQISAGGGIGMTTPQMMTQANFVSATPANGWVNPAWDFANTWLMYEGLTYPLLSGFMTPLTVTANNVSRTYGQANPAFGVSYSVTPGDNLLGTVGYSGTAQSATNVGSYVIAPGGLYSNQGGYIISYANGTLTIDPLALTGTIATGSSVYGSALKPGAVTFTNLVGSDQLGATVAVNTTGNTSTSGHLSAGSYTGIESVSSLTGADAGNYTLAGVTGNYTVGQLALTGTLASGSSVYSAALTPGAATLSGVVSGDLLSAGPVAVNTTGNTSTSGHLSAGSYTGIESVSSLTGADAGNYTLAGVTGNYTVGQLALTGTLASGSSVYSAALTPGAATLSGVVSGDLLSAGPVAVNTTGNTSTSGHLSAGSYTGIESVSSLTGADAGNYTLAGVTGNYTVGQLALTGTLASGSSVYSAALTPGAATLSGVVSGDLLSAGPVAVNTTGNTSTSGHLSAGSYTGIESVSSLTGADAGNYTLAGVTGNYTVGQLALTGTLASGSSVYSAALTPGAATLSGVVSGDLLSAGPVAVNTTGNTSTSGHLSAGSYTGIESVSSLTGADAGNYTLAGVTGNYTVGQLALTGTLASGSSVYSAALTPGAATLSGVVSGDLLSAGPVAVNTTGNTSTSGHLSAGSYTGIESVSSLTGADAGNYTLAGVTGNYTVGQLALTGTLASGSSVYSAALTPGAATLSGVVSGDLLSAGPVAVNTTGNTSTSGHLSAGSYTGIESVSSLTGADAGNYTLAGVTGNYTVGQLALTGTLASGSSVYSAALTPGAATLSGVVSGDLLSAGPVAVNTTGNTSTSGHLSAGSYTGIESVSSLTGADAGNYTLAGVTGNYTVGQLALTGTLASGSSVYSAALTPGAATLSGVVSGDLLSAGPVAVNTTGNTSTSGHLSAGSYTGIESVSSLTGADAGNYTLAGVTGNYTVGQLALTGTLASGSSVYSAALTPGAATLSGVVSGDLLSAGPVAVNTTGNTSTSGHLSAGSYTGIESVSSLTGADAGNYTLAGVTGNYTVGQLALTGTLASGSSVYSAALTPGAATLSGVVSGDLLSAGPVAVNTTGNTSTSGHLSAGSYTGIESVSSLTGADAGNYTLAGVTGNYTVGQLALTGTLASGSSVYSAALTPGAATLSGVVSGDLLSAGPVAVNTTGNTSTSGHLSAGSYTGIESVSSLTGADAGNYTLAGVTGNYTVGQLALTVTSEAASNRIYNGSTAATLTGGTLVGVFSGDTVTLTQAGSFASKTVGTGIAVTASDSLGGPGAGNYTLTEPLGLVANITPATLTYTAAAASFTAGQTPSGLSGTLSGFVLADNQANATAGPLVWTTTAAAGSQPGHYAIDGGGLTATNYVFVEAPGDATALTLQSGSSAVIPPVVPPLSGPGAATLGQAQTAAGTLDLLSSQTSTQVALSVFNPDVTMAQSSDSDHAVNCTDVSDNRIVMDKKVAINPMVPSLRIACGGVKLPDNLVDVNAR